jgi:hypothetical protein
MRFAGSYKCDDIHDQRYLRSALMMELTGMLANIATALGIPIAIIVYIEDRRRTRRERELETYRELSDRYFQYLQVCFQNPDLSTTEIDWAKGEDPTRDPRQDLLVQMAVSLTEAAYFFYRGHRSSFRRLQWEGWQEYIVDWCSHPAFVGRWPELIAQYDDGFRLHVEALYQQVHGSRDSI